MKDGYIGYACDHCTDNAGEYRINSYTQDVNDEEVYEYICDECYRFLELSV